MEILLVQTILLLMPHCYEYPRPALTVDCIIFGLDESDLLKVLLIQRGRPPFQHFWALPGGFVQMDEDLRSAALRELEEETGLKDVFIEQLYTFGAKDRDPRGRVISVAYYALVNLVNHSVKAASDAKGVKWFDINSLPNLAFDHGEIVEKAIQRLRAKVRYQPIGFELLPKEFTLSQLQKLYETILGVGNLNKRNFRTRILKMNVLKTVGRQKGVAHRPATLYTFDQKKYNELFRSNYNNYLKRAVDFEI